MLYLFDFQQIYLLTYIGYTCLFHKMQVFIRLHNNAGILLYTAVVYLSDPFTLSSLLLLNPWGILMKLDTKKYHNERMCILQRER
jgi:hypothetical protein